MVYKAEYRPSELLCPSTYNWVDAEDARATLRKESPLKHCCKLFKGETPASASDDVEINNCVSNIRMDLGHDVPVTLSMLTPDGQDFVRPLVKDFVTNAGVRVANQCTIDFK